jgi:hypothetical protein
MREEIAAWKEARRLDGANGEAAEALRQAGRLFRRANWTLFAAEPTGTSLLPVLLLRKA